MNLRCSLDTQLCFAPLQLFVLAMQVANLEGFTRSLVRAFEGDATEAVYNELKPHHSSVKVLPVRELKSEDGRKREVDGVVISDDCAAIIEAKQELDDTAVPQLASCLQFIR